METIYIITSNPEKVEIIKNNLKEFGLDFNIEIMNEEYPEDKTEGTTSGVVLNGSKWCAEKYKKSVIVTDAGLFIKKLNGFPGVNTKFVLNHIGNEGILKLMENEEDREANWILSIGYCEPEGSPIEFTSSLKGRISKTLRGEKGFGFDPIFIAGEKDITFGEDPSIRDFLSPFKEVFVKFADWYRKRY